MHGRIAHRHQRRAQSRHDRHLTNAGARKERKQAPAQISAGRAARAAGPRAGRRRSRPDAEIDTRLLRSLGHDVRAAGMAQRAIEMAVEDLPRIAHQRYRNAEPIRLVAAERTAPALPADDAGIAISGYAPTNDLKRSQEAGFIEHIVKPIDVQRFAKRQSSAR